MTSAAPAMFGRLLAGRITGLVRDDGRPVPLDPARWRTTADADDAWLLDRCAGAVLDLGCGPGRLVAALAARGVPALGVDSSPVARMLCRRRGAAMLCRDLFAPLPGEGTWAHVLLADGNIGIGGDPPRLLTRAAALLGPGGTVLVETGPDADELWCGSVRVCGPGPDAADGAVTGAAQIDGAGIDASAGRAMPWACVGARALRALAPAAGFAVTAVSTAASGRTFAELTLVSRGAA
ncbi:class I SAM-dependent methyltransferase [Pseudonocardia sp. RS010]|uniref:class I SAM-dependent methyltransferase n=1 Tax=Pseudonocardia sp. RS010 TaxID=3385979 RepID=UPI0039A013FF